MAVIIISVVMVVIGIFTSNTACASIMIPVVIGVAVEGHFHPLTLLFPVTCCCSCAFLLPSSTPPNLIAYTSKSFTTSDLFVAGLIVSVFCIIFFDLNTFTIFPAVIGYDWKEFPSWAVFSVCCPIPLSPPLHGFTSSWMCQFVTDSFTTQFHFPSDTRFSHSRG